MSPLSSTAMSPASERPEAQVSFEQGMLDEPALSRQWVVRRLQRALSMDRRHSSLWEGMSDRCGGEWEPVIAETSRAAAARATAVSAVIVELGSSPYSGIGLTESAFSALGWMLGLISLRVALGASRRASAHALAEYVALSALVDGAAGVPEGLVGRLEPLLASARSDAAAFREAVVPSTPRGAD